MTEDGICVCGHVWDRHEHYRVGTDCGVCPVGECESFRSARPVSVVMLILWLIFAVSAVGALFALLNMV